MRYEWTEHLLPALPDVAWTVDSEDGLLADGAPESLRECDCWPVEMLRLAAERDLYKAELAAELTRGAEEIRRLSKDAAECDRALFAEIGAALDCTTASLIETPHSVLSLTLGGELLMAAFTLRQDRDRLAARVRELESHQTPPDVGPVTNPPPVRPVV